MSDIILHIPHSSMYIPKHIRENIKLNDIELEQELWNITDLGIDKVFEASNESSIECRFSRLLCDVERFLDDENEPMSKIGMGAIYTKTSTGKILRETNELEKKYIIDNYYRPYHEALELMADKKLKEYGGCTIIDCHSFNDRVEYINMSNKPDICIGTDEFHTPNNITEAVKEIIKNYGYTININRPFSGSIVPLKYYQKEKMVKTIMIEINRRTYINNTGGIDKDKISKLKRMAKEIISTLNSKEEM